MRLVRRTGHGPARARPGGGRFMRVLRRWAGL